MNDTDRSLHLEVAADPSAPAVIHAELRRWLAHEGVRSWAVDDLLVASDEITFETILIPSVTRIDVRAEVCDGVVHLAIGADRRRPRELRMVPFVSGIEIVDDIGDELGLAYQVADTFAVRTLPDRTVVELTKIVA
ncbi:MAG TPA: hypothetical protein VD926_00190 [Acidimicrobiales bacterium]|nr:hypothetical protein [Acidimicrobiales bacterium]